MRNEIWQLDIRRLSGETFFRLMFTANSIMFSYFLSSEQLDLQLQDETGGDISSFVTNGEWDLLGNAHDDAQHFTLVPSSLFRNISFIMSSGLSYLRVIVSVRGCPAKQIISTKKWHPPPSQNCSVLDTVQWWDGYHNLPSSDCHIYTKP